ncbi:MAG: hypothetical protein HQK51_06455 [Oligoflexia bacterium]|nr:hypothetical protein [Oligoflexia bacterium]
MKILIGKEDIPSWFQYPPQFLRIIDQNLIDFDPWWILNAEDAKTWMNHLKKSYPNRELVPFAKRGDCDDIACWQKGSGNKIIIIHNFASPGWEERKTYETFWDWLRFAIETTIEHDP